MEDEDLVSRSYLSVFFLDINNLKDSLAGYRSIILRLELKTGEEAKDLFTNLKDDMKNAVIQWSDSIRHNVERCHIAATALHEAIQEIEISQLEEPYKKIITQFAPDLEMVSKYTFEINKVFVKGTIEKILKKMDSFYEQFTNK